MKKCFKITFLMYTFSFAPQALCENRFADRSEKNSCTGFASRDKCKKRLDKVFDHKCISSEEYEYSLKQENLIVPLCTDDDNTGKDSDFHGWCYCVDITP